MTDNPKAFNPKAFPLPHFEQNGKVFYQDGMTLRDWFAGQVANGLVNSASRANGTSDWILYEVACDAYRLADAMLEARKAKP